MPHETQAQLLKLSELQDLNELGDPDEFGRASEQIYGDFKTARETAEWLQPSERLDSG